MEGNFAYCFLTEDGETSTFEEALSSSNASKWMAAMQEELEALYNNKGHGNWCHYHKGESPLATNGSTRSSEIVMIKWTIIVLDWW